MQKIMYIFHESRELDVEPFNETRVILKENYEGKAGLLYLNCHKNEEDFEIIWFRIAGSNEAIPDGYEFLGYDITEEPDKKEPFL